MGILDKLTGWRRPPAEEPRDYALDNGINLNEFWVFRIDHMSVEELYRTQPHLRTVTSFIARMVSSVSLHAYRREDDLSLIHISEPTRPY